MLGASRAVPTGTEAVNTRSEVLRSSAPPRPRAGASVDHGQPKIPAIKAGLRRALTRLSTEGCDSPRARSTRLDRDDHLSAAARAFSQGPDCGGAVEEDEGIRVRPLSPPGHPRGSARRREGREVHSGSSELASPDEIKVREVVGFASSERCGRPAVVRRDALALRPAPTSHSPGDRGRSEDTASPPPRGGREFTAVVVFPSRPSGCRSHRSGSHHSR